MGFWHTFGQEMRSIFMLENSTATFAAEEPYQPIAQLLYSMTHSGSAAKVSRADALSVPAVMRGRNMICNVATLPLVTLNKQRKVVERPFLAQIDPDVPNEVTLAQTLEDLFFEGMSFWWITEFDFDRMPLHARHLAFESVTLQPPSNGRSPAPLPSGVDPRGSTPYVDGREVDWGNLVMFMSLNPPLLTAAARPIRRAIKLDNQANMYADNPKPLDFFTPADGADPADDDDIRVMLANWQQARQNGSTAYIPAALKYNTVDTPTPANLQLVEQQAQVDRQLSNAMGIDAVDVGVSTTSDTYQNAVDRRQDKVNTVLAAYIKAITSRLSMDDVTRPGERVEFDLDDYLRADPKTRAEVANIRIQNGTKTVEEDRKDENMPDLPAGSRPAAPAKPVTETVNASRWVSVQLDSDEALTFANVPLTTFAVDVESRVLTGLAVPFGKHAVSKGRRFQFLPGSLQFADISRVKLLRDHSWALAVGRAIEMTETETGYVAKFKVARGPDGDRVLALAEDGVLDGLSIGVDFTDEDITTDPANPGVTLVHRAYLREVSLTAMPAFDDSRLTSVKASRDEGNTMSDTATPEPQAPAAPASGPDFNAMFSAWMEQNKPAVTPEPAPVERPVVNPTRSLTLVSEELPYTFDRGGNFLPDNEHVFSADLHSMAMARDEDGTQTEAGRRVMGLLRAAFAVTTTGNVTDLNPTIQRPDMYVDQRDYRTPLWDMVSKGAPPNGVNPFRFPKFSSAGTLVGDHTEGTEPTSGNFTATGQTVTPTALSGKASLPREVWDMGGNPAVSTLVFNQMLRGYREGLEQAVATFLNTLTAATDINLNTGATAAAAPTSLQLSTNWESALTDLQFIRGYDFDAFAIEANLYKAFVAARDGSNRPLYPIIAPSNANGTATSRFRTLDLAGVVGVPSWALTATPGSVNNSWLFDSSTVHGWASAPQRLEFPGTNAAGGYAPVAMVDLAIWGYKAFANSDIAGVRQVTYDTTT